MAPELAGLRNAHQGSRLLQTARRAVDDLVTAARHSRIGRAFAPVLGPLRAGLDRLDEGAEAPDLTGTRLHSALGNSRADRARRTLERTVRTAADRSLLACAARGAGRMTRASFLYRWLTAEPEPEVIIIDLRRTWSVGPPLALLDRFVDAVVPGVEGATAVAAVERVARTIRRRPLVIASALLLGAIAANVARAAAAGTGSRRLLLVQVAIAAVAAIGLRSTATLEDIRDTRAAELLIAALEPPEPPEPRQAGDDAVSESEDVDGETSASTDDADDSESQSLH